MIFGISPNGSNKTFKLNVLAKDPNPAIKDAIKCSYEHNWMAEYTSSRFFTFIREILTQKYSVDDDWYEHLFYSNLMKIAPIDNKGGKPSNIEYSCQLELCLKLLKLEIASYKPKNVVIVAGYNWATDFLMSLNIDINHSLARKTKYFLGRFNYKKTNIIVVARPDRISVLERNRLIKTTTKNIA